jgi:hypothetical protein
LKTMKKRISGRKSSSSFIRGVAEAAGFVLPRAAAEPALPGRWQRPLEGAGEAGTGWANCP